MSASALDPMTLHYHVEQLLARYVHCIDGDELEQWPMLFTEKCLYRVIAKENVDRNLPIAAMYCDSRAMLSDRVISLRHANIYERHQYRHIVSSLRVEPRADGTFDARSNYVVYRTRTNGATEVYNAGFYLDHILVQEGRWLFAEKQVIFDTNLIDALMVIPL